MRNFLSYVGLLTRQKLFSLRTYMALLAIFFLINHVERDWVLISCSYEYPFSPWVFPFLFGQDIFRKMVWVMVFYFFTDVPYMQYENMFQVIRSGRKRWALAHVVSIVIQSFFVMCMMFLFSIISLKGRVEWNLEWGKLLRTLSLKAPTSIAEILTTTLNNYTPIEMVMITILLGTFIMVFHALLMYMISVWCSRAIALVVVFMELMVALIVHYLTPNIWHIMVKVLPIEWIKVAYIDETKYLGSCTLPSLSYMVAFLGIGCLICIIGIVYRVKTVEFNWNKEE